MLGACGGLLAPGDVRRCLGPLDLLVAEEKERERSRRVALAGRAVFCRRCQAVVGVVAAEDRSGGPVPCPRCGDRYCADCGTPEHGEAACPAPKEVTSLPLSRCCCFAPELCAVPCRWKRF
jgi:hypothetical protein